MNVLLFSRYGRHGASSRIRTQQYVDYLASRGIRVTTSILLDNDYLAALYAGGGTHALRIAAAYVRRGRALARARRYDLVWIEKELFPWLPPWAERVLETLGIPYVVDYDDATFHHYDRNPRAVVRGLLGRKVDRIMCGASAVVAGNEYLAERARIAGARRIEIVPSAVDCRAYSVPERPPNDPPVIGWIGTPITSRYLVAIEDALAEVCRERRARLILVGARPDAVFGVEAEIRPWSEASEVADVQSFDVGIMPLPDEPWERGKCGYKLIQYMACGRAVVTSPVGANRMIVAEGESGFMASSGEEWIRALSTLRDDADLRGRMGAAGRRRAEKNFCTSVIGPRLADILQTWSRG